jgi:hypothetical protein
MEILCSSHIFQYVIVNIITKGPFKNTFLSFTKNLHVVSDSSILGFGIGVQRMAKFLECTGGNETGHESGWCTTSSCLFSLLYNLDIGIWLLY